MMTDRQHMKEMMKGMMGMMHDIKAPSDNELQTLVRYLQTHAK